MRFTFPTTTIASISGAVLVTLTPHQVLAASASFAYGSIRATPQVQGNECSFGTDLQDLHADMGVLEECATGMSCVEDDTSSIGGRCVPIEDSEVPVKLVRNLQEDTGIACTFLNGTAGSKCVGLDACLGTNAANIGCGSCLGEDACSYVYYSTIQEGSCIGEESCHSLEDYATVGPNSCIGERACATSENMTLAANSCHGYKACYDMNGNVTISTGSCWGDYACCYINSWASNPTPAFIGKYSCRNETNSCFFVDGKVGDFSCWGFEACERMEDNVEIGSHSCHGYQSCASMGDSWSEVHAKNIIYNYSCIGSQACYESYNDYEERITGFKSCVGEKACYQMTGSVGSYSCGAEKSCYKGYGYNVGHCQCNMYLGCAYLSGPEKDYDNCPAPTTKPSAKSLKPSFSPSAKPTAEPTAFPTKHPSVSPSSKPSSSPSVIPTAEPTTFTTKNPTVPPSSFPIKTPNPSSKTTDAPTAVPTSFPSKNPTSMPAIASAVTIKMDSTLKWNITCSSLNTAALEDVAQIVEKSIYEDMKPHMSDSELQSVSVYELCNQNVGDHSSYQTERLLQTFVTSDIKLFTIATSFCNSCEGEMFNETNQALMQIVEDGTLTNSIQSESGGGIKAVIGPSVDSSYSVITNTPTGSPSAEPKDTPTLPTSVPTIFGKAGKNMKSHKSDKGSKAI